MTNKITIPTITIPAGTIEVPVHVVDVLELYNDFRADNMSIEEAIQTTSGLVRVLLRQLVNDGTAK